MRKTNANPYLEEVMLRLFDCAAIVPNLADVVTAIKTHRSVKVMMDPARGNVVARSDSECAKCSGMISTFVTQISTMTIDVLHGEQQPRMKD